MLPDVTLTAVVSGTEIALDKLQRPAVLIFHGQNTADAALAVNSAVRAVFPAAEDVFVASVIDLRQFPAMFHGMVKPELEKAYHKAAATLPAGADATALIVLLPDWRGTAHDACAVADSTAKATVLVTDAMGNVVLRTNEDDLAARAVAALQEL